MVIEVEYQCSLSDYQEACKAQRRFSMVRNILIAVMFCGVITLGIFLVTTQGREQGSAQLLVVGLAFGLWLAAKLLRPLWIKRDFAKHPNFSLRQVVSITEDGVRTQTEVGQSETKWLAYKWFRETQNLFLLFFGARLFEVIPKRAFAPADLDQFRELLLQKLPAK